MSTLKPDRQPIRLRGFIEFAKKHPDEAAAVAFDEMRATLIEMGVSVQKIASLEDRIPGNVRKLAGMSDEEAFALFKRDFERYMAEAGVDPSVIRSLKYV